MVRVSVFKEGNGFSRKRDESLTFTLNTPKTGLPLMLSFGLKISK